MEDVSAAEALLEAGEEKDHDKRSEEVSDLVSVSAFKAQCGALRGLFSADRLLGTDRSHGTELAAQLGLARGEFERVEEACAVEKLMVGSWAGGLMVG